MRQGQASRDGRYDWKREPVVKEINPKGVSQIGSSMGNHATQDGRTLPRGVISEPMYTGKEGFGPPRNNSQATHKSGSQGRTD
jgi:hypothetical protein